MSEVTTKKYAFYGLYETVGSEASGSLWKG